MIDPISALAAVTTAVNLVKKAAKTVDDVRSLGPVLSKYFDAKADAVKVLDEVHKGGFKGSNMGKAVELELALADAKNFEEQVKGLFFPNNMDVWDKIVARRLQMDQQDKIDAKRARDRALRAKQELLASDWSDLPSVRNTAIEPHLLNGAAFDTYRAGLRAIVINKPAVVEVWPVRPDAAWSEPTP